MKFTRTVKAIKNPKKAIKYLAGGGARGKQERVRSEIRNYALDKNSLETISLFFNNKISQYHEELLSNNQYLEVENKLIQNKTYLGEFGITEARIQYIISRFLEPEIIIETGVASGLSSFMFLLALKKNNKGKLYSIDLPPNKELNKKIGQRLSIPHNKKVGWLVPESIKERWKLILGDSKKILPEILQVVKKCDLFLHDSDHSYQHMKWEYETVWPYITQALLSDDINSNNAYDEFVTSHQCRNIKILERMGIIIPS